MEWVTLACVECGETFQVTPAWVKNGRRKFCSKKCHGAHWGKQKNRLGHAHTQESRVRMSEKRAGKAVRENASQWKGGRHVDTGGYIHVMVATLPPEVQTLVASMVKEKAGQSSPYILEHRAVMAQKLGRPLLKSEVVHHINGVKDDNSPENLAIDMRDSHSMKHRDLETEIAALRKENESLKKQIARLKSDLKQSQMDGAGFLKLAV